MRVDSVFSTLTETPFEEDRPLIPQRQITRAMDAIEEVAVAAQMRVLETETEQLLREATPYLENPNLEAIAALDWNAGVKLQAPIVGVWESGWETGGEQLLAEAKAAIPRDALKEVEQSFSLNISTYALPSDVLTALRILLRLRPGTLTNSATEQAVLRRAIQLAGSFSRDQLGRLKVDLIAAISPDINGVIIDRRELLTRIENTLGVGRVRSEMIARTELTEAYNSGRVQTASQSALVEFMRFLSIADDRTTDICASRNGMLIPIGDAEAIANNKPSLHVQCRSTLSPVMPRVNPLHAEWVADPARDYRNRALVALPSGWR